MKKSIVKHSFIVTISVFSLMFVLPFLVGAKSVNAQNNTQSNPNGGGVQGNSTVVAKKLSGDGLKSCQNREKTINNIMARVQDRAQKQSTLMARITERVQAFYSEKNMTLSNYDELVANIESKKMVAEQAMNNVRVMNGSFSCGNDDPKSVSTQFKSNAKIQNGALAEYKNAIKDLLVAVKSAYNSSMEEN